MSDFEEFWKIYPRHEAKLAAEKSFQRALKVTTIDRILEGAKKYAALGREKQFTKMPATWLNQGCWMDFDEKPPQAAAGPLPGVYVKFTDPAREAWDAYGKLTRGRSYPSDRAGGWWFPTRWPPNQTEA